MAARFTTIPIPLSVVVGIFQMKLAVVFMYGTPRWSINQHCWPLSFKKNVCVFKSITRSNMQEMQAVLTDEFVITKEFASANEFSMFIEQSAIEEGMDLIDVILNYCEEKDIDPDVTAKLVTKSLKEKLAVEFTERNMLRNDHGTLEDL
jgi:hypothetical protein